MVELKGKKLLITVILGLLLLGTLSYNALPEAYCPLEDKTVKYIYMSPSNKTVTKVVPGGSDDSEFKVLGDRCQKGMTIGQWIPINAKIIKEEKKCNPVLFIGYTDNGKYLCDGIGRDAVCLKNNDIDLPDLR